MRKEPDEVFVKAINEHAGIIHKIARAYFYDNLDREDVIQEMLFQLWRSYPSFEGKSQFSTWMYRVCFNTALTWRRRMQSADSLSAEHREIPNPPPEQDEENLEQLYRAIEGLSGLNKALILLYLEDRSYEEMAMITGLTKSNVSVRLVRIKKELEQRLTQQKTGDGNA